MTLIHDARTLIHDARTLIHDARTLIHDARTHEHKKLSDLCVIARQSTGIAEFENSIARETVGRANFINEM